MYYHRYCSVIWNNLHLVKIIINVKIISRLVFAKFKNQPSYRPGFRKYKVLYAETIFLLMTLLGLQRLWPFAISSSNPCSHQKVQGNMWINICFKKFGNCELFYVDFNEKVFKVIGLFRIFVHFKKSFKNYKDLCDYRVYIKVNRNLEVQNWDKQKSKWVYPRNGNLQVKNWNKIKVYRVFLEILKIKRFHF